MTAEAQSLPFAADGPRRLSVQVWIESLRFDSSFFLLSPIVTLPLAVAPLLIEPRLALLFFLLSFPHYVSTAAFFFWDENHDRIARRWIAFMAGPVLIALAYWALYAFEVPRVIQIVLFLWNTFHVARQSCGIISIYRHRTGAFADSAKRATNFAIIGSNLAFSFFNIETHPQFGPFLSEISPWAIPAVKIALGVVALAGLVTLGKSLRDRIRAGQKASSAEIVFIATSILIFHPFLWVRSSGMATAMMLLPHYLQYLGIVWLLHRRRFRSVDGSTGQRALGRISTSTPLLLTVLFGIGMSVAAASVILRHSGHEPIFEAMYLLLAFEHFYLDGLFWAFRDPAVRSSLGPWLTRYDAAALRAA